MNKMLKRVYVVLFLVLIGTAGILGISYAQSGSSDTLKAVKVSKSLSLGQSLQGKVTVRVTNMQSTDIINIRPINENKINAVVLSITEQDYEFEPGKMLKLPKSGEAVAESSLSLSEEYINFARPQISGKVGLDIALPKSAEVEVFYNGGLAIKSTTLISAISVRDAVVGKGFESTGSTLSKLMFPQTINKAPNETVEGTDGSLMVPFSAMQLKKSYELTGISGPVKAVIDISTEGLVENVTVMEPLNPDAADNVEEQIRLWEFFPYKKNGTAVKVSAVFFRQ
jgi:hypothetical protein